MRSGLRAVAISLLLAGGTTALATPRPVAAAYAVHGVIYVAFGGMRPQTPLHAAHHGQHRLAPRQARLHTLRHVRACRAHYYAGRHLDRCSSGRSGHNRRHAGRHERGAVRSTYRGRRDLRSGRLHVHHPDAQASERAVPGVTPAKEEMLNLINAERAQAGAGPLHFDATLNTVAQARSQDMIDRHYFSHYIPGGGMVFDILDRDHVQYEMAGENIALNNYIDYYPLAKTVSLTNADFMHSPDHRANILEPKYSEIGLGMAFEQGSGKLVVTEVFVQP